MKLLKKFLLLASVYLIGCGGCSVHQSNVNETIGIGQTHQGGIIFYLYKDGDIGYIEGEQHGLIAAPSDQTTTKLNWKSANKICDNLELSGYSDWYLPSKEELNQLYLNRTVISKFSNSWYWSSTKNSIFAWVQNFNSGTQYYYSQNKTKQYFRAVRAF